VKSAARCLSRILIRAGSVPSPAGQPQEESDLWKIVHVIHAGQYIGHRQGFHGTVSERVGLQGEKPFVLILSAKYAGRCFIHGQRVNAFAQMNAAILGIARTSTPPRAVIQLLLISAKHVVNHFTHGNPIDPRNIAHANALQKVERRPVRAKYAQRAAYYFVPKTMTRNTASASAY
jgi:hypothetical protein